MNLKVGIVGLPNVGKSTLFNALMKKQAAFAANYPFATIEPNIGVVPVPDARLAKLADITEKEEGKRPPLRPATVEFVDIAGLVKGASEGQGLGNRFLSHIREVNIICHVVRYFENSDIVHVSGSVDPQRDREIIQTELILADLQTLEKQKEKTEQINTLIRELNNGKLAKDAGVDPEDVKELQLLTMKPWLEVANVAESQLGKVPGLAISAETEAQLAGLTDEEQKEYLNSLGLEASGLDRLIREAYSLLGLISFLTTGIIESRAWTIVSGTKAPQAAGTIHTDFEKKFIKADVADFTEFVAAGGWKGAREAGKVRSEGRDYEMRDGDVVEFKIGT